MKIDKNIHLTPRLRLHPHKHTGKLLHHRHTSYHALFLVVALAGLFMVGLNQMAKASDYVVTATVPAPLPTDAATFTHPSKGTVFSTSSISVGGTCPIETPAIIIVVYEGTTVLGSRTCSDQGIFSMPISFGGVGTHSIVATVMNFTGQTGATSAPLSLTYALPTIPVTPVSPSQPQTTTSTKKTTVPVAQPKPTPAAAPLDIASDSAFIVYGPTLDAEWRCSFHGGTPPYKAIFSWGDGTHQEVTIRDDSSQSVSHHYEALQVYNVKILLTDAAGQTLNRSITAITPSIFSSYYSTQSTSSGSGSGIGSLLFRNVSLNMYLLYALVAMVVVLLWQVERLQFSHPAAPLPVAKRRRHKLAHSHRYAHLHR